MVAPAGTGVARSTAPAVQAAALNSVRGGRTWSADTYGNSGGNNTSNNVCRPCGGVTEFCCDHGDPADPGLPETAIHALYEGRRTGILLWLRRLRRRGGARAGLLQPRRLRERLLSAGVHVRSHDDKLHLAREPFTPPRSSSWHLRRSRRGPSALCSGPQADRRIERWHHHPHPRSHRSTPGQELDKVLCPCRPSTWDCRFECPGRSPPRSGGVSASPGTQDCAGDADHPHSWPCRRRAPDKVRSPRWISPGCSPRRWPCCCRSAPRRRSGRG